MKDRQTNITLYLTGESAGKNRIISKRYRFVDGKISLPIDNTGAIRILKKYYACSDKPPAAPIAKPVAKPSSTTAK